MFSGLKMESMTIPSYVNEIGNNAFELCDKLSTITFEQSANTLNMGYYDGFGMIAGDAGPFYSCPLTTVNLYREINYTFGGAVMDDAAEGLFGNKTTLANVTLGDNVKTIHPYMFAATRIQQLHLPESVDKIGKNVIEGCELLNAIVFYNDKVRPEVETGAFGTAETLLANNCFLFMPWRTVYRNGASLYYNPGDKAAQNYWHVLYPTMVDEDAIANIVDGYRIQPHDESLYLDKSGYEWYRKRYYNQETITPPVF